MIASKLSALKLKTEWFITLSKPENALIGMNVDEVKEGEPFEYFLPFFNEEEIFLSTVPSGTVIAHYRDGRLSRAQFYPVGNM